MIPNTDDKEKYIFFFYVLLTVHLSISLDKDQLDAHLFYFILQYVHYNPLHVSSINAHHQEVNCIDAASGIVLSVSGLSVHRLRENCSAVLSQPQRTIPDAASMQLTS